MKRLLLSAFMLVAVAFSAEAQDKKNAIGLRLGDNDGFGGEISYQRWLDTDNRLEFDLGWRDSRYYDAVKLAALYQWVWNIDGGFIGFIVCTCIALRNAAPPAGRNNGWQ